MNFHYRTRQSNHGANDDLAKFYLGQVPIIRRPGLLSLASFDVTLTFYHVLAAQAAWQLPKAVLQATIEVEAEAPSVAPQVKPAAL